MVARRTLAALAALALGAAGWGVLSLAGAEGDDGKSAFIRYVEDQISTDEMRIGLGQIEGALNSDVTISRITVADAQGVWLSLEDVHLVWDRLALVSGKLDIDRLEAGRIAWTRNPDTRPMPSSAASADMPDLRADIAIGALTAPSVEIGAPVFGLAARLAVDGRLTLDAGSLAARFAIERRDAPGRLGLEATYDAAAGDLDIDFDLSEPEGGVLAAALAIPGKPALDLRIEGTGPLDRFAASVRLAANGDALFGGPVAIAAEAGGHRFDVDLSGGVAGLLDPALAPYFGAETGLQVQGLRAGDGTVRLDVVRLKTGVAAIEASGALAADGFPTQLDLTANLGGAGIDRVPLPFTGGASVAAGTVTARLGDGRGFEARAELSGLERGGFRLRAAELGAVGTASKLADPTARRLAFEIAGAAVGISGAADTPAEALGDTVEIGASGEWAAGGSVQIAAARIASTALEAGFAGTLGETMEGTWRVTARDLKPLSALAGRDLAGSGEATLSGRIGGATDFDLALQASLVDLGLGVQALDGLFAGDTTISGRVSRAGREIAVSDARVVSANARLTLTGGLGEGAADLTLDGRIDAAAAPRGRAAGAVLLRVSLAGPEGQRKLAAVLRGEDIALMGQPFEAAALDLDGTLGTDGIAGAARLSGALGGRKVAGTAKIGSGAGGALALSDLDLAIGAARATGGLARRADATLEGALILDIPDLAEVAPLLLMHASGAIAAEVTLTPGQDQSGRIVATLSGLGLPDTRIEAASVDLTGEGLFSAPAFAGRIEGRGIAVGDLVVATLAATARRDGPATAIDLSAELDQGRLSAQAAIAPASGGYDVRLASLALASVAGDARLAAPATVSVIGGDVALTSLDIAVGTGRVSVSGTLGARSDLAVTLRKVPLSLANAFAPALEARGTLDGTVAASGSLAALDGRFDLAMAGVGARPLDELGLARLDVAADGTFARGTVTFSARTAVGDGVLRASGSVGAALDIAVALDRVPLSAAVALAPDLDLDGRLSGTVKLTGRPASPLAGFDLAAEGVSARPLREAGLSGLAARARGSYGAERIRLDHGALSGNGLALEAKGSVPLSGAGLDIALAGTVPLSLTDRLLIDRGTRLSGEVRGQAVVTGSLAAPQLSGTLAGAGILASDPASGLVIRDIVLDAGLDARRVVLRRLEGALGAGRVAVTGTVGLTDASLVDLAIALRQARYEDGRLVAATLDGDLTLSGRAEGDMMLRGDIAVDRAEITVPESLPTSAAVLDVTHVDAAPAVLATLRRAGLGAEETTRTGASPALGLDLTVSAPARVFVRGRGLDTELGGQVRLTGRMDQIRPVGAMRMRSGRLDILGKRISFEHGEVTLLGDLDPTLDFRATTRGDTVSVTVLVAGHASDPQITFNSVPDLPQDEVLSQLVFGRGIDQLSPLQIAQLGYAAAQLAGGGGGPGVLDRLRAGAGLDNLDVTSDAAGNVALEAGRYVSENVYLGVRGSEESSAVTLNLDIVSGLTARASAGQKESSVGLFYEVEY